MISAWTPCRESIATDFFSNALSSPIYSVVGRFLLVSLRTQHLEFRAILSRFRVCLLDDTVEFRYVTSVSPHAMNDDQEVNGSHAE